MSPVDKPLKSVTHVQCVSAGPTSGSSSSSSSSAMVQSDRVPYHLSQTHADRADKVSAEPPPSALNMTLPAFGAERRRRLLHGASCFRSISPARLALSSKPAGCSCYCRSMGQTDRRTDRRQRGTARFAAARRTAETGFVKLPHPLVDVSKYTRKYTR